MRLRSPRIVPLGLFALLPAVMACGIQTDWVDAVSLY